MGIAKINQHYIVKLREGQSFRDYLSRILKDIYGEVDSNNIEVELYYEEGDVEFYDVFYLEEQIALLSIFPDQIEKQIVINFQPI